MCAQRFWRDKHQGCIRVFNPYALTNCKSTTESAYRRHEREKRRCYERRILEVEHGAFTPLVFSAVGGMGTAATVMYKRLACTVMPKDHELDQMLVEFLSAAIGHHVHSWCTLNVQQGLPHGCPQRRPT